MTLHSPDLVLTDTEAHRAWIAARVAPRARMATLYLGRGVRLPPDGAAPAPSRRAAARPVLRPVRAACTARTSSSRRRRVSPARAGSRSRMIGTGPERSRDRAPRGRRATCPRSPSRTGSRTISCRRGSRACDVALGIFGTSTKAQDGDSDQGVSSRGGGPRRRERRHAGAPRGVHAREDVLAVRPGDAGALAAMLRRLRDTPDLAPRIGAAAGAPARPSISDRGAQGRRVSGASSPQAFPDLAGRLAAAEPAPMAPVSGRGRPVG